MHRLSITGFLSESSVCFLAFIEKTMSSTSGQAIKACRGLKPKPISERVLVPRT